MVFLFGDQHVMEEGFLELVNNMLTSGMVPALFADDEKEGIVGQVGLYIKLIVGRVGEVKLASFPSFLFLVSFQFLF